LKALIGVAREDDRLREGHFPMLLWRIATNQLEMSPDQFQAILGAEMPPVDQK
jgi:hypothetical protein